MALSIGISCQVNCSTFSKLWILLFNLPPIISGLSRLYFPLWSYKFWQISIPLSPLFHYFISYSYCISRLFQISVTPLSFKYTYNNHVNSKSNNYWWCINNNWNWLITFFIERSLKVIMSFICVVTQNIAKNDNFQGYLNSNCL